MDDSESSKTSSEPRVCLADFEKEAKRRLGQTARDYYFTGAGDSDAGLRNNEEGFSRLLLRWKTMSGVESVDLSTSLLGRRVAMPVGVSPTAMHALAHGEGELATARACGRAGVVMTLSTVSTRCLEDVAATMPESAPRWFQLYMSGDRPHITQDLVERAERHGYSAVVVTIDCAESGRRLAELRRPLDLPKHLSMANFDQQYTQSFAEEGTGRIGMKEMASMLGGRNQWSDIKWLCSISRLPVIAKGVMTSEDAIEAVNCGIKGVWVSNHGARQIDTTPATIEALPEVVSAVGHRCEVYLDGGVRCGTDVLKALALGANAVFIGRPALSGLACGGQTGVEGVLRILREELSLAMLQTGTKSVKDIRRDVVVHENQYRSQL